MNSERQDQERREEARRIFERAERDSSNLLLPSHSHPRERHDAGEPRNEDWTEVWGRRIGRSLGIVFAVILIFWLISYLAGR